MASSLSFGDACMAKLPWIQPLLPRSIRGARLCIAGFFSLSLLIPRLKHPALPTTRRNHHEVLLNLWPNPHKLMLTVLHLLRIAHFETFGICASHLARTTPHLGLRIRGLGFTHRPLSSSFLGLPYRILRCSSFCFGLTNST